MKVKEFIELLLQLDQEANIWQIYDPPCSCTEPEVEHLVGDNADYAAMFRTDGVKVGDYAIISS